MTIIHFHNCSIGLSSGEYGGRKYRIIPRLSAYRIAFFDMSSLPCPKPIHSDLSVWAASSRTS